MKKTLVGYIHMMVAGESASSGPQTVSWDQLHRMVMFYHNVFVCGHDPTTENRDMHVPGMILMEDFVNMLSLCCLVIWCNALSAETYQKANDVDHDIQERFGVNRMDGLARRKCAFMKKAAKTLLLWLIRNFNAKVIMSDDLDSIRSTVVVPFIGSLVSGIPHYFSISKAAGLEPRIQPADSDTLMRQLLDPFHDYDDIRQWVEEHKLDRRNNILYEICGTIHIVADPNPIKTRRKCFRYIL